MLSKPTTRIGLTFPQNMFTVHVHVVITERLLEMRARHDSCGKVQCCKVCHKSNSLRMKLAAARAWHGFSANVVTHAWQRKHVYFPRHTMCNVHIAIGNPWHPSPVATGGGGFWWIYLPQTKFQPPNWNMKHRKSVFLWKFQNIKPPFHKRKATL